MDVQGIRCPKRKTIHALYFNTATHVSEALTPVPLLQILCFRQAPSGKRLTPRQLMDWSMFFIPWYFIAPAVLEVRVQNTSWELVRLWLLVLC